MTRVTVAWLALLLGGAALIGAWALPPDGSPFMGLPTRGEPSALEARHATLRAELTLANELLRHRRVGRHVLSRIQEAPLVVDAPSTPGGERFASRVQREVEGLTPKVGLGAFMVEPGLGADPRVDRGVGLPALSYYTGTEGAGGYCALTVPGGRVSDDPFFRRALDTMWPELMGPCLLYARHGMPGDGMAAWLEAGGHRFAAETAAPLPEPTRHRTAFGMHRAFFGGNVERITFSAESCLAGRLQACREVVLGADGSNDRPLDPVVAATPLSFTRTARYGRAQPFGPGTGALLFDLEAELGPDRFARLWSADGDVERAFEATLGEPLEAWVHRWAVRRLGDAGAGPGVPRGNAGLALLAVLGLGGVAMMVNGRRRLG